MLWRDIKLLVDQRKQGNIIPAYQRPLIYIDVTNQRLYRLSSDNSISQTFPVSTAVRGLGNLQDSFKTPVGIHRIKEKIGADEPSGMVFKGRRAMGVICKHKDNREEDEITSRILWLDGLEDGTNKGGVNDTFSRYIYIHGTSDELRIGKPVSRGCIRMKNSDVIDLFDDVQLNDIVLIE